MNRRRWSPALPGAHPRVLVLSTQYRPGPWCMRSLRACGFEALGAERRGSFPARGRSLACPRPVRFPSPVEAADAFVEWLERTCRQRGVDVVLPNSEDAVRVIAARAPRLGAAVVAGPTADQYLRLCDKAGLAAAASAAGVTHPLTTVVTEPGAAGLPGAPVIVKAALSGDSLPPDLETVLAITDAQRDDAVRRMVAAGSPALVQEHVRGTPWVVHGVRGADGTLLVVTARVATTYPRGVGVSSISRTVTSPEQLLEDTRRLLDLVGYVGPFCTNAIERDGAFFTHDVNLRVAASVGIAVRAGLEVPGLGARAALGLPLDAVEPVLGVSYINMHGELHALLDGIRGLRRGGSVAATLRAAARASAGPRVVDPSPLDPLWIGTSAGRAIRKAVAKVR